MLIPLSGTMRHDNKPLEKRSGAVLKCMSAVLTRRISFHVFFLNSLTLRIRVEIENMLFIAS